MTRPGDRTRGAPSRHVPVADGGLATGEPLTERTPRVAAARKLLRRAARGETGRFLVEGVRPVRDALTWAEGASPVVELPYRRAPLIAASGTERRVHDLFVTDIVAAREPDLLARARAVGVRVNLVTAKAAAALSDTVTPQGVAAVCTRITADLDDALRGAQLVAVLHEVADPGNAGTVIRTADAAGADAVILTGDAVDPHNPKCVRAAVGSLFHVPIARARALDVADLRSAGLTVLATTGDGEVLLDAGADALLAAPTAWLFGTEAHGLPEAVAAAADHRVRVPIHGRAESLNLATAAAVCLYASARVQHPPV